MITEIIILFSTFCILIWLYLKWHYSYWRRNGFPEATPTIPFGNLTKVVKQEQPFACDIWDLYKTTTEPLIGIYLFFRRAILIRDPELVRNVLCSDFGSFHDRGLYVDEINDPLSASLLTLPGQKWRNLRAKLTPSFSSGKIRNMFSIIMDEGNKLQSYLEVKANNKETIAMKDLAARYAIDIIGRVGFGIDVDTITNPNDEFRKLEKYINASDFISVLRAVSVFLCPNIMKLLKIKAIPKRSADFLNNLVEDTIKFREENNVSKKDFMQSLIQLRNSGKISGEGLWEKETAAEEFKQMSIEECTANAFLFYLAGFDTSSSAISNCLFELSRNPQILAKAQRHVDEVLEAHNGEVTYECIKDMKYLDCLILETVRLYPSLSFLNRECTEDYSVPNTNYVIKKGTPILISLVAMHRDPKYFPEPERFNPDRFLDDVKGYDPAAFMPFGEGPRACIGIRMGKVIVKTALTMLLSRYNWENLDPSELKFEPYPVVLLAKGGIPLRVSNRIK